MFQTGLAGASTFSLGAPRASRACARRGVERGVHTIAGETAHSQIARPAIHPERPVLAAIRRRQGVGGLREIAAIRVHVPEQAVVERQTAQRHRAQRELFGFAEVMQGATAQK